MCNEYELEFNKNTESYSFKQIKMQRFEFQTGILDMPHIPIPRIKLIADDHTFFFI